MEEYIRANMEVVELETEDVIATSGECNADCKTDAFYGEAVFFPWSGC